MREKGAKAFQIFYIALILFFLFTPIFILILFSFNSGDSLARFDGFSLRWYEELFRNSRIQNALYNTVTIAIFSTLIATVVGTIAALGINNMKSVRKSLTLSVSNIPILNPDIVTGISFMLLFTLIGVSKGYMTMLLAHVSFNIPYVILAVMPRLRGMNVSVYEASLDLGASPLRAFKDVIVPEITPGIITGSMICLTMSIDDFLISYFTTGPGVSNLSIEIYNMAKRGVKPTVNAVSTLMFIVIVSLLLFVNIKQVRDKKKKEAIKY